MNNTIVNDNLQVFSREFENILHYYKRKQQRQNELRNLIETIDEIESSRRTELQVYQQQLSNLSKISDDESNVITSKYINEKEKCHHLEQQVFILTSNVEDLKVEFSKEKKIIITKYEKELEKLRGENEEQKQDYINKEIAMSNKLQGIEAAAAMQFDEMETKLKNLLDEANQKWREANSSCNTLRSELIRTKNQMNQMNFILNSKQKECQDLQDKLCTLEAKFFKAHETNVSDDIVNLLDKDSSHHKGVKFHTPTDVNVQTSVQNQDDNLTKGVKKGKKETTSEFDDFKVKNKKVAINFKRKVPLPPLIQVSNASESKFIKKKRKLFNINDIGNLNEIY